MLCRIPYIWNNIDFIIKTEISQCKIDGGPLGQGPNGPQPINLAKRILKNILIYSSNHFNILNVIFKIIIKIS